MVSAKAKRQGQHQATLVKGKDLRTGVTPELRRNQRQQRRFLEPVGPKTSVCPTSSTCRLRLNGVEPDATCISSGARGG